MESHIITKEEAVELIKDFLNDPVLGPIGKTKAMGGVINLKTFQKDTKTGWAFWYCWNTEEPEIPEFFLACETNTYEDPKNVQITSAELKRSNAEYIFKYNSSLPVSTANVLAFLDNPQTWTGVKKNDGLNSDEEVLELTQKFTSGFPIPGEGNVYNQYPFGFFVAAETDQLINQGEFVRYYFGYDSASPVNKIRIILVSTDAQGNNQTDDRYILLQQSWPPHPVALNEKISVASK